MSVVNDPTRRYRYISVAVGTPESVFFVEEFTTITISPGAGGSMTVTMRGSASDTPKPIEDGVASYSAGKVVVTWGGAYEIIFTATASAGNAAVVLPA